jgi:hypothetical protein
VVRGTDITRIMGQLFGQGPVLHAVHARTGTHFSGKRVYQELGDYFRIAENPPRNYLEPTSGFPDYIEAGRTAGCVGYAARSGTVGLLP